MEHYYGVFVDRGVAAGHLQLMRWLVQPGKVSVPHLTIRYADSHMPDWMKEQYEHTVLTSLNLESAGTFDATGLARGSVETAFLTSFSSELEALSYKPDFPDSIFHLSIYAGPSSRLAYKALRKMAEFRWGLTLTIPGTRVMTFQQYRSIAAQSDATSLLPEAEAALRRLSGESAPIERIAQTLEESTRLDLLATLCEELHEMSAGPRRAVAAVPELFEDADPDATLLSRPVQGSLFPVTRVWDDRSRREDLKASGTYITPPEVASEMAQCALAFLPDEVPIRFLDPALGGGILYAQLLRLARQQGRVIESAVGVEKHPARAQRAEMKFGHEGLRVLAGDFLTAEPQDFGESALSAGVNLLVANPPYLRPDTLLAAERVGVRTRLSLRLGVQIRPSANTYTYFVLSSMQWLSEGAVSAWLLPRDALFGASSSAMRQYLARSETVLRIHEYADLQRFQSARVSQVLVVLEHRTAPPDHKVQWTAGEYADADANVRYVPQARLAGSARWDLPSVVQRSSPTVRIGDLFDVRRGIATGANRAFTLDDEGRRLSGPGFEKLTIPILPKARFIPSDVIESDEDGIPILDRRLWLIDSNLPQARVAELSPFIGQRLEDIQEAFGNRLLLKRRHPFYRQEQQAPPPFVCIAMARVDRDTPARRFLLNRSSARVLNNYHAMYLKPDFARICRESGLSDEAILGELEGIANSAYVAAGRWYHSGLVKLEPGDLRQLRVEGLLASLAQRGSPQ